MQVVWFKRDLRINDNLALSLASEKGDILPIYIIEPELWQQPDMSHRQYLFLLECLEDLNTELTRLGQPLIIMVGNAVEVFEQLIQKHPIKSVWSHQETWNAWTYQRDIKLEKFFKQNNILWHQPYQNGVVRCLADRDKWALLWHKRMSENLVKAPAKLKFICENQTKIPTAESLGLEYDNCYKRQKGGRVRALRILDSFLYQRGCGYTKEMSSPVTAFKSCSRLSPYIAFGVISIKEVYQLANQRKNEIKVSSIKNKTKWLSAMRSFLSRLRWHCHFMQKLEDQSNIEYENLHSAYDQLRKEPLNQQYFEAWKTGNTGFPMIDACMRALIATGWLNFRMRAMLMSFASYHLWLDWRVTSLYLARLFTDYEPGIHYSQVQMQSGTTGINSIRIYNPIKQSIDQDPNGEFIKRWIPELENVSDENIHTPWLEKHNSVDYPNPIVDEKQARKFAADNIYKIRKDSKSSQETKNIIKKHASRKKPRKIKSKQQKVENIQGELF
ncbi:MULTISPECIES: FAD-binding domain-containing protein [Francisella]|uniref:FAD-binding domain-containing protein n=1 Tax=Francisella TaxID=262 RepID=UPI0011B724F0|nr:MULTISPECIES: deoxyribodipyrimidine photo-lyase [Francisella]